MGIHGAIPKGGGKVPTLVSTLTDEKQLPLLDLDLETNPLDGQCDTRLNLSTRPLEVIYDAVSLFVFRSMFFL